MNKLHSFTFKDDLLYREPVTVTFDKGLTLFRGWNKDANAEDKRFSNGSGKTRLPEILEAFCFASSDRDHYKKMFLPSFEGTLDFTDSGGDRWSFHLSLKDEEWKILKNGERFITYHQMTKCQELLAETLRWNQNDWHNFTHITGDSIYTLLKGEPAAKRKHLETLFNLDKVYEEKRQEYVTERDRLGALLTQRHQDKARLNQVQSFLKKLPCRDVLDLHLEATKQCISVFQARERASAEASRVVAAQISRWETYYRLCDDTKDLDPTPALKERLEKVQLHIFTLQDQVQKRLEVDRKLLTLKSLNLPALPVVPAVEEPASANLVELTQTLMRMYEKTKLIDKYKTLKSKTPKTRAIEEIKGDYDPLVPRYADTQAHLKLLKKGDVCSECKQPLEHLLNAKPLAVRRTELEVEERQQALRLKELADELQEWNIAAGYRKHLASMSVEIMAFERFGRGVDDVEKEIAELKSALACWSVYRAAKDRYEKTAGAEIKLKSELASLGYPEILQLDLSGLAGLKEGKLRLEQEIKAKDALDLILDEVLTMPPLDELKGQEADARYCNTVDRRAVDSTNVHLGLISNDLKNLEEQSKEFLVLEEKIKDLPALERESRIMDGLVKFFSPGGFKNYELRKRCDLLIEKANFWSYTFFQEIYEWSMPKDLKGLDFLVQPARHKDQEPYSARKFSKGEVNRASRVLLFAQLSLVPPNKGVDLIFLDEIEANLDEGGQGLFGEIAIPKLKETFPDKSIVIISHDKSLETNPDINHLWLVTRENRQCKLETFKNYSRSAHL